MYLLCPELRLFSSILFLLCWWLRSPNKINVKDSVKLSVSILSPKFNLLKTDPFNMTRILPYTSFLHTVITFYWVAVGVNLKEVTDGSRIVRTRVSTCQRQFPAEPKTIRRSQWLLITRTKVCRVTISQRGLHRGTCGLWSNWTIYSSQLRIIIKERKFNFSICGGWLRWKLNKNFILLVKTYWVGVLRDSDYH